MLQGDDPNDRYTDLGPLGAGGMGEVRRVYDRVLDRDVAMKSLRPTLQRDPSARARFEAEATVTAGLSHPAIVPVHDRGTRDGIPWYTMKLVEGRTLGEALEAGLSLRRAVEAFARVCEAMAFAHDRGVIHRDIKPANIMIGPFGEVLLMDWGLAWRFRTPAPEDAAPAALDATARLRPRSGSSGSERFTGTGTLIGSPPYMAPEQADPSRALVGPPADVYALGGTLYQIVTGRLPRLNQSDAIAGLLRRDPVVLTEGPEELQRIASRALAQDIDARYPDAGPLAEAVRAWLDDEARRARARSVLSDAVRLEPEAAALRAEAAALYAEAHALLDALPPHASVERKAAGWALQDAAADRLRAARLTEVRAAEAVQAALRIAPDLPEARAHLTQHFRQRLTAAEAERDADTAAEYAQRLRLHDPEGSAEWLRGDGRLTLITEPPGARARLFRHVLDRRRLVPEFVAELPPTPIIDHPLPMGSHVIELTLPGRLPVSHPVFIDRHGRWDGIRPGDTAPTAIWLPPAGGLDDETVQVPAGWFIAGDPGAPDGLPERRVFVDAFAMRVHPVTNIEYIAWLDWLVETGAEHEALRHAPKAMSLTGGPAPMLAYRRGADGRFAVGEAEGIRWRPTGPVGSITWHSACAYAVWRGQRDGLPWRLPHALEWEKAARGADRRRYPWGDVFDPTWAVTARSRPGRPAPLPVTGFPGDVSPYGVRGLAGNVRDLCRNRYRRTGPTLAGDVLDPFADPVAPGDICVVKGGSYSNADDLSLIGARFGFPPEHAATAVGFRLVRSLSPPSDPAR